MNRKLIVPRMVCSQIAGLRQCYHTVGHFERTKYGDKGRLLRKTGSASMTVDAIRPRRLIISGLASLLGDEQITSRVLWLRALVAVAGALFRGSEPFVPAAKSKLLPDAHTKFEIRIRER